MRLQEAEEMCLDLLKENNLHEWSFMWIKSKRVMGWCDNKYKVICLSNYCTFKRKKKAVRNTILHEIAHAITKEGHNKIWRNLFISLGGNGKTHSDDKF